MIAPPLDLLSLVTQDQTYLFMFVFSCWFPWMKTNWNSSRKNLKTTNKNSAFSTKIQPFWNVLKTFPNSCFATRNSMELMYRLGVPPLDLLWACCDPDLLWLWLTVDQTSSGSDKHFVYLTHQVHTGGPDLLWYSWILVLMPGTVGDANLQIYKSWHDCKWVQDSKRHPLLVFIGWADIRCNRSFRPWRGCICDTQCWPWRWTRPWWPDW